MAVDRAPGNRRRFALWCSLLFRALAAVAIIIGIVAGLLLLRG
ncbi:hypothetical protein [Sphingomonas sp. MMS24-J13]